MGLVKQALYAAGAVALGASVNCSTAYARETKLDPKPTEQVVVVPTQDNAGSKHSETGDLPSLSAEALVRQALSGMYTTGTSGNLQAGDTDDVQQEMAALSINHLIPDGKDGSGLDRLEYSRQRLQPMGESFLEMTTVGAINDFAGHRLPGNILRYGADLPQVPQQSRWHSQGYFFERAYGELENISSDDVSERAGRALQTGATEALLHLVRADRFKDFTFLKLDGMLPRKDIHGKLAAMEEEYIEVGVRGGGIGVEGHTGNLDSRKAVDANFSAKPRIIDGNAAGEFKAGVDFYALGFRLGADASMDTEGNERTGIGLSPANWPEQDGSRVGIELRFDHRETNGGDFDTDDRVLFWANITQ